MNFIEINVLKSIAHLRFKKFFYLINLFQRIPNSLDFPDLINSEIVMFIDLR